MTSRALVLPALLFAPFVVAETDARTDESRIRIAASGSGFVVGSELTPFCPWGFNYDHDEAGRLIEDYWNTEWSKVEDDFREMRELGANVVRVHLQIGRFLDTAESANATALGRLADLLTLCETLELRLDITGLGCYHAAEVPGWYDALDEEGRWSAQERFWSAIAERCRHSSAVFCYDLMNEPVVPGPGDRRESWLGPPFGDKTFVQFVTRELGDRTRHDVARTWTQRLVAAIRRHDPEALVTIGLVDWSLERPGLTSGFAPEAVAPELDFLCVHCYPVAGEVSAALATLRGFQVGKPVVIEETFPLRCSAAEFDEFLLGARPLTSGVLGFYWGRTLEECRATRTIPDAMMAKWLERFRAGPQ